jgi:hypothetical protein
VSNRLNPGALRSVLLSEGTAQLGRAGLPNLIYFSELDRGNHFAAWQEPGLFSAELRAAFRSLR